MEDVPPSETGFASRAVTGSAAYAQSVRVLLTGKSGAGKSTFVSELRQCGYDAYDADDHGFSEPREGGRWGWRIEMVSNLLASPASAISVGQRSADSSGAAAVTGLATDEPCDQLSGLAVLGALVCLSVRLLVALVGGTR